MGGRGTVSLRVRCPVLLSHSCGCGAGVGAVRSADGVASSAASFMAAVDGPGHLVSRGGLAPVAARAAPTARTAGCRVRRCCSSSLRRAQAVGCGVDTAARVRRRSGCRAARPPGDGTAPVVPGEVEGVPAEPVGYGQHIPNEFAHPVGEGLLRLHPGGVAPQVGRDGPKAPLAQRGDLVVPGDGRLRNPWSRRAGRASAGPAVIASNAPTEVGMVRGRGMIARLSSHENPMSFPVHTYLIHTYQIHSYSVY